MSSKKSLLPWKIALKNAHLESSRMSLTRFLMIEAKYRRAIINIELIPCEPLNILWDASCFSTDPSLLRNKEDQNLTREKMRQIWDKLGLNLNNKSWPSYGFVNPMRKWIFLNFFANTKLNRIDTFGSGWATQFMGYDQFIKEKS